MSLDSLPKEENSQEIGKLAGRALTANLPQNWTESPLAGDSDFGIDYFVQVKNASSQMTYNFFLQLKGTKSPKLLEDGNTFSFEFDVSTLNYYRKTEPALMVALVDLSTDESPKNCITYYKWLDESFLDSIKGRRETNDKKVTIHISKSDVLDESLEVDSYYLKRLETRDELLNLHNAVSQYSSEPLSDISAFTNTIKNRPVIIDAVKEDSGSPWIDNPENHNSGKLKTIFDLITSNQIIIASEKISGLEEELNLTAHEEAELHNLKAYILLLNDKEQETFEQYDLAHKLHSGHKYKIKYLEAFLRRDGETPRGDLEFIISKTENVGNFNECFLKAKCLMLLDKKDEAFELLEKNHPEKLIAKLLLALLSGDKKIFFETVESIDIKILDDNEKYNYYLFIARHHFY